MLTMLINKKAVFIWIVFIFQLIEACIFSNNLKQNKSLYYKVL